MWCGVGMDGGDDGTKETHLAIEGILGVVCALAISTGIYCLF